MTQLRDIVLTERGVQALRGFRWHLRWKRIKCLFGRHWLLKESDEGGLVYLVDAMSHERFALCASCGKRIPAPEGE